MAVNIYTRSVCICAERFFRFRFFCCCALFTKHNIKNINRNYMKYKKRKEIKQYIARKKKAQ